MVALLLVLNTMVQLIMSMAIQNSMTVNPYTDATIAAMQERRNLNGHAASAAFDAAGQSVVLRACNRSDWSFYEVAGLRPQGQARFGTGNFQ